MLSRLSFRTLPPPAGGGLSTRAGLEPRVVQPVTPQGKQRAPSRSRTCVSGFGRRCRFRWTTGARNWDSAPKRRGGDPRAAPGSRTRFFLIPDQVGSQCPSHPESDGPVPRHPAAVARRRRDPARTPTRTRTWGLRGRNAALCPTELQGFVVRERCEYRRRISTVDRARPRAGGARPGPALASAAQTAAETSREKCLLHCVAVNEPRQPGKGRRQASAGTSRIPGNRFRDCPTPQVRRHGELFSGCAKQRKPPGSVSRWAAPPAWRFSVMVGSRCSSEAPVPARTRTSGGHTTGKRPRSPHGAVASLALACSS
jgi:hypothetical protein